MAPNGQADGVEMADDDAEVMDVTEAALQSKRARQADCAIDLDAHELEDENDPPQAGLADDGGLGARAQGTGPPTKHRKMTQAGAPSSSTGGPSMSASADAFIPKG